MEWIGALNEIDDPSASVNVIRRGSRRPQAIAVSMMISVFIWVAVPHGSSDTAIDPTPKERAPISGSVPGQMTAPFNPIPAPPLVSVVATSHNGGLPIRIRFDQNLAEADQLEGLFGFTVDRGGQWLAATGRNSRTKQRVLWAGPIDGELEPIAVNVRGFAWHDTAEGRLAYVEATSDGIGSNVTRVDFNSSRTRPVVVGPSAGWLQDWGDWGFVLSRSRSGGLFDVLTPSGEVALEQRGSSGGFLPGMGLVLPTPDFPAEPLALSISTGQTQPILWLADGDTVWDVSVSKQTDFSAVQVSNFAQQRHELLVVSPDGEVVKVFPAFGGQAAWAWTRNGTHLLYILERGSNSTLIAYEPGTDLVQEWPLVSLHPAEHWTRTIAVPPDWPVAAFSDGDDQ